MAGVKGRSGGRNAKTRDALAAAGTLRADRHKGIRNPRPSSAAPLPPKSLEGEAKAEWARMIARLTECKTLSHVDDGSLFQYCRLFAETEAIVEAQAAVRVSIDLLEASIGDFEEAKDKLAAFQELGKMLKLECGYTSQIRQGRMSARVYLIEFGLTPASRSRVKIAEDDTPADPMDEFDSHGRTH